MISKAQSLFISLLAFLINKTNVHPSSAGPTCQSWLKPLLQTCQLDRHNRFACACARSCIRLCKVLHKLMQSLAYACATPVSHCLFRSSHTESLPSKTDRAFARLEQNYHLTIKHFLIKNKVAHSPLAQSRRMRHFIHLCFIWERCLSLLFPILAYSSFAWLNASSAAAREANPAFQPTDTPLVFRAVSASA